ncbi:MAG: hypothetical protein ACRD6X_05855, partial [Pyrinomonadaceae bacterium]
MTNILKDAKQILKTRHLSLTARQISAILTMMALLLPIAAPIPVWAQNMNLPRFADSGLRLTADGPTLAESSVDLVGELFKGFASFVYAGKVEEKKREKPFSREELEKRVKGIETQISEEQEIKAGQLLALTGIPVDMDQNPVNGLAVEWKSSDEQILKITNNEMAV